MNPNGAVMGRPDVSNINECAVTHKESKPSFSAFCATCITFQAGDRVDASWLYQHLWPNSVTALKCHFRVYPN